MKIVCVCGLGMGSSLILKMSVEEVLADAGVNAEIEHSDASSAKFDFCDYIVTTSDIAKSLEGAKGELVICNSFIDKDEIKKALTQSGVIVE